MPVPRPWGVVGGKFPITTGDNGVAIGEIRYERPGKPASDPSLLLKVLLTSQPLSIQVHPDDAYAQSIGLPSGKTEAWYVVSAGPGGKVALGLTRQMTPEYLRESVEDGSISTIIAWQAVSTGDVVSVPAGTIHAIGPDLIIAEIQQRSDTTYRIFDYGRNRELHVESAIAVANAGPADVQARPIALTDERTLLVSNAHFVFEKICLAPGTIWRLEAARETWFLVLNGGARAGSFNVATGEAIFAQSDRINIHVGPDGLVALLAYSGAGGPVPHVLKRIAQPGLTDSKFAETMQKPSSFTAVTATHGLHARKASDEATPAHRVHRQLSSATLRHRDLHIRST
jgi:mannose-6-phosphate isomerase